jgi:hypothetical protein
MEQFHPQPLEHALLDMPATDAAGIAARQERSSPGHVAAIGKEVHKRLRRPDDNHLADMK